VSYDKEYPKPLSPTLRGENSSKKTMKWGFDALAETKMKKSAEQETKRPIAVSACVKKLA
jgi:hypothetical protein